MSDSGLSSATNPKLPPGPHAPVSITAVAVWMALAAGLGEAGVLILQRLVFHQFIRHGPQILWMAPLTNLVIFAFPAAALIVLARRWPRLASSGVVVFIFSLAGYLSLLLLIDGLSKWALLVLAIGLALQTARFAAAHPKGFYSLLARTLGWTGIVRGLGRPGPSEPLSPTAPAGARLSRREFLASAGVTLAGLAAGVQGWQWTAERLALARLPSASPGLPNVIFIVLDTVRAASLSLYGYRRLTTPNLARIAQAGVGFDNAIATAPWTLPSHASMFTGRYPHELTADWKTALDASSPTLAEIFSAQGYVTAGFVANVLYCQSETGLSRGFAHYDDYGVSAAETAMSASLGRFITNSHSLRQLIGYYDLLGIARAETINHNFLTWLADQGPRPFFAFLNYFDAHEPYTPAPPFDNLFGTAALRRKGSIRYWDRQGGRLDKQQMTAPEVQLELDAYEGAIAYLDQQIGLLFDELDRRDLRDNTLVVITADHGEQFAEHELFGHGNSLYLPLLRVPLLLAFPGRVPAGLMLDEPVTLRDLAATVVDLVDLAAGAQLPGRSLAEYWRNPGGSSSPGPSPLLAEVSYSPELPENSPAHKGAMHSVIMDQHHFIVQADGQEELFDWQTDPDELKNLVNTVEGRRLLVQFRTALKSGLTQP